MARAVTAPEGRGRLVVTLGFAAFVAGLFSLAAELLKERHDTYIQTCTAAAQIVTDDALDGDLDPGARKAIAAEAGGQLGRCWEK